MPGGGAPNGGSSGSDPGGNGGFAGESGESGGGSGGGGSPAVPKKCADYQALPAESMCFDDATHAYVFSSGTRTFSIAASSCALYGMHLASIESPVENAFIVQTAAKITDPSEFGYFWIGGSTIGTHGTWHWTDGSVFWTGGAMGQPNGDAYFNWRSGSPVNVGTDSCAFSDDAGWQDGDCTQNRPYVCEAN